MNPKKHNKYFGEWLILPALAMVCFIVTRISKANPNLTEKFYSQFAYPVIARSLSFLSSAFPFSISDIYYLLIMASPLVIILLLLFRKIKFWRATKITLNLLAANYVFFYLLWGFNYFRPPLNERLDLEEQRPNKQEFITAFKRLTQRTNTLYANYSLSNKQEIDSLIEESYRNISTAFKLNLPLGNRPDKRITFSHFYSKLGITGYYGPFFNEVHVNKQALAIEYPFILAHEKAHQLGITSEAEANFHAWMACNNSKSKQLQYTASLILLHHFVRQAHELPEYKDLIKDISPEVKSDINKRIKHWRELRQEKLDKAASKVNDVYLKSNRVKKGIGDYRGVVEHVMNFSLDSTFQQKYCLQGL
jgi:hypothetical protein